MIQGFGYLFFNSVKDLTNNRFSPSIVAGYGPYNDLQTAITTILSIYNTDINKTNVTLFAPPLGLPFGIISGGKFTEYVYEKGNFEYANTAEGGSSDPGIVPTGSGIVNIPAASDNALGVILLGYTPGTNVTNKFALKTSSNKAYVEIPQDYLVSAALKQVIDALVEVYEDGVFVTDPNMLPVAGSESGGGNYSALSDRLDRIEAILGQLMGSNATQDATFIIENTLN